MQRKRPRIYRPMKKPHNLNELKARYAEVAERKIRAYGLEEQIPLIAQRMVRLDIILFGKETGISRLTPARLKESRDAIRKVDELILQKLCEGNQREYRLAKGINERLLATKEAEWFAEEKVLDKKTFMRALQIGIKTACQLRERGYEMKCRTYLAGIEGSEEHQTRMDPQSAERARKTFDVISRLQTQALFHLLGEERASMFHTIEDITMNKVSQLAQVLRTARTREN